MSEGVGGPALTVRGELSTSTDPDQRQVPLILPPPPPPPLSTPLSPPRKRGSPLLSRGEQALTVRGELSTSTDPDQRQVPPRLRPTENAPSAMGVKVQAEIRVWELLLGVWEMFIGKGRVSEVKGGGQRRKAKGKDFFPFLERPF